MTDTVHVAVAVIRNATGQIFITVRPNHVHQGGLWEFPGGKVENGEIVQQALQREILEEVGIEVQQILPLIKIPYQYPDKRVLLDVWEVLSYQGQAHGREGQECRWVNSEQLLQYTFPPANRPIVAAVRLPDRYLVTPEPGSDSTLFLQRLKSSLQAGVKLVQFRAKTLPRDKVMQLANEVIQLCRHYKVPVLLNTDQNNLERCVNLAADGIHVTSQCLLALSERPVPRSRWFAASCHNTKEINQAGRLGADFIVVGAVKATYSHPMSTPLGWEKFTSLTDQATMPVYAIGGMLPEDVNASREAGGQGIAAIGSLWRGQSS